MRWMAIDHGIKNIGIAFSDKLEILSTPFAVWPNNGEYTINQISILAHNEEVDSIVVGLPLHKDGNYSSTANLAKKFGEELRIKTRLPLIFWNEYLTSAAAKTLQLCKKQKRGKAKNIDALAAAILLQDLIETRRMNCDS